MGIETSCDETGVAIVEDGTKILANTVSSQVKLHSKYGGVIPELASRKQIEVINILIEEGFKKAKISPKKIDAVAVTSNPGLIGSLLVGISSAQALSYVWEKPVIEVNHVEAHLYANFLTHDAGRTTQDVSVLKMPFLGLVVSGGHTSLFVVKGHRDIELIGRTRDDAAGEAFDKVAKILGLPYPGGPQIEKIAKNGKNGNINFPRPYLHGSYDFSFSGLKTAVAYYVKEGGKGTSIKGVRGNKLSNYPTTKLSHSLRADIAKEFQDAVVEVLVNKTIKTAVKKGIKNIALGGGVTANKNLRNMFTDKFNNKGINIFIPPIKFCLDNAAMVACRAYFQTKNQS